MTTLEPTIADRIIKTLPSGDPPAYGSQFFTAGLEPYLTVIDQEYLGSFIKNGGSAFKMVVGTYGGGKTHLLYAVRDLAWKHGYAVSYVRLAPGECPFHKLEQVYAAIAGGLTAPLSAEELLSGYEFGIRSFLKSCFAVKERGFREQGLDGERLNREMARYVETLGSIENVNFENAVKNAFMALCEGREDDADRIFQWLAGQGYDRSVHKRYGILQRIDRSTAFPMIRSLAQAVKGLGFSGLVVLFDEAERVPSLSSRQVEQLLSNLRELIDECGHTRFQSVMIFYAVPDESFLQGRLMVYEALRQRLSTVFDEINPTGVKISLEKLPMEPIDLLVDIGRKLRKIYEIAYSHSFKDGAVEQTIEAVARWAIEERFGDISYKRLFVQNIVRAFHYLRKYGAPPKREDIEGYGAVS